MPAFPRAAGALSRLVTPPRMPEALQNWSQSGDGRYRSTTSLGRTWEEVYPVLDTTTAAVRALLATINQALREGTEFTIQIPYWHIRLGAGGGSPQVNGSSQTGSNLVIDNASSSVTGWLKKGDMIQVAGCPVIYDVTADVDTDGSGDATIPINPPIFVGQSPANNAAVEIDPSSIYFNANIIAVSAFPSIDQGRMDAGLTITWREQPT